MLLLHLEIGPAPLWQHLHYRVRDGRIRAGFRCLHRRQPHQRVRPQLQPQPQRLHRCLPAFRRAFVTIFDLQRNVKLGLDVGVVQRGGHLFAVQVVGVPLVSPAAAAVCQTVVAAFCRRSCCAFCRGCRPRVIPPLFARRAPPDIPLLWTRVVLQEMLAELVLHDVGVDIQIVGKRQSRPFVLRRADPR